jgi:hypothetical protein
VTVPLSLELSDELLDAIAARVIARLGDQAKPEPAGYLDVPRAAEFLACSPSRVYALCQATASHTTATGLGCCSTVTSCAST